MSALLAAGALAVAWVLFRNRPDQRARLRAVLRPGAAERRAALHKQDSVAPGVLARAVSRWRRKHATASCEVATIEAVFALAAELRAGQPPGRALALVAAQSGVLAPSLGAAAAAVAAGAAAGEELRRIAAQPGCAGFRGVAAAWDVTSSLGGPVADVLDRLGEVLDAEQHARAALAASMAGSRVTMLLLATLPAFGLALGQALGAHPVHLLVHRPIGWLLLTAAAVLDGVGVLWTGVIIRKALR